MYVRFVVSRRDEQSRQLQGIFTALYELEDQGALAPHELEWFRSAEQWFNKHLARPQHLARSRRPNASKQAISWLKLSAREHVTHMRELVALLVHKDVPVEELRTDRPGYIVYEDEHQITAEPFIQETFRDAAG
jgi:hypothetical protein